MKLRILIVLALLVTIGCSKSPREKVTSQMQAGHEYMEKFEFDKAQEAFDQAGADSNGYLYNKYGNGEILEQQLFYYDALNAYLDLVDLYPDSALGYSGVYRMYRHFGYYEWAFEAAAKYYERAPASEDAALAMIQGLIDVRQSLRAREEIDKANANMLDKNTAEFLTALVLCHLNEFDSAQMILDHALSTSTISPLQYAIGADVLDAMGLTDSAMIVSRRSVGSNPVSATSWYRHFERSLTNNYYADARQTISRLKQKGAGKVITLALESLMAKDQENYMRSRILNSDFMMESQKNVSSMMFDMYSGGIKFSDALIVLPVSNSAKMYMDALKYNEKTKAFVNIQILRLKVDTDLRVDAFSELGLIHGPLANIKQVKLTEAYVQYKVAQFDVALKKLDDYRNLYSDNPDWLTEIANIYAHPQVKKEDLALKTYDQALAQDKWFVKAIEGKVKFLRSLGRFQEALNEFAKFPHFEMHSHPLRLLKALCLCENNDFAGAMGIFAKDGAYLKGNLEPFRDLSAVLERKYRNQELNQLAELCSGWAGENVDILLFAARLLADQKENSKALALIERALKLEPTLIEARVQKGRVIYYLGQRNQTFALFDEVFKEDASDGDVNYYYSKILAAEKIEHDRATNMARSALRAFYSDEKAFVNICEVYSAYGEDNNAYGDAMKASMEIPNSAVIWYKFGLASHNLGRANSADHLKKAIDLGLGGEDLKKAKEMLAKQ